MSGQIQGGQEFQNPLNRFQSYSTHFVLLACRTTEAARYFANNHVASTAEANVVYKKTLEAIDNTKALGDAVKFYDGTTFYDDEVYLVIDTRRFGQFTIDSLKYEVLINGVQAAQAHANLATQIEMTILDSVGISFINYMQWLMDVRMQTNFDGMVFLLRTIFVGHNPGKESEIISSCTIPMHLQQMEVNLDFAKGVYTCVFLPNINFSTIEGRKWLNIGAANRYFTGNGSNKLGDIIDSFVNALNAESSRFYSQISSAMKQGEDGQVAGTYGRRVEYIITIPNKWREFTFTGPAINEAIERNFAEERKAAAEAKQKAEEEQRRQAKEAPKESQTQTVTETHAQSSHLTVDSSMTITQVLDIILNQVQDVKKFANAEIIRADDKVLTFYKYVVGITSNKEVFQVQVHVVPFEVPNVPPPTAKEREDAADTIQGKNFEQKTTAEGRKYWVPKNFFELNYIFTGKNVDILNFDMKIENLSFMLASNSRVSEGQMFGQAAEGQAAKIQNDPKLTRVRDIIFARKYDPIFIPHMTEEERTAFRDIVSLRKKESLEEAVKISQQYTKNLSSFYANSPISINLTIRGNPDIMLKFADQKPMPHRNATTQGAGGVSTVTSSSLIEFRNRFEEELIAKNDRSNLQRNENGTFKVSAPLGDSRYYSQPVFFRVRIKGPNVDPRNNQLIAGEDFSSEVLQDNYYVVFKVTNAIEKGVFTQDLELYSHNVFGLNKLDKDGMTRATTKAIGS